ncbi:MAG: NADH-quinone oxidoreductase subunit A [SAR324 cluster bacterium]|nr:NADH-quinone oxidoreductase subunit A [SAR324 cluster bacterium]
MDYFLVLLLAGLGVTLVGGGLIASRLFAPRNPGGVKNEAYECGEETIGSSWVHFNVGYYLFALIFLIFDVEAAFLFPWAVVFRDLGGVAFLEVGIFILVLIVGLIYAWRKGVLEWV